MKAKFLALMALVLGMVSCQNDFDGANVGNQGEVDFTLNVAVPELTTRAAGSSSAASGLDNINLDSDYDVRYLLEVYDANGELAKERFTNYEDKAATTSFNLRLIPGRKYTFVVWADFVRQQARVEGTNYDLHYVTTNAEGLKNVTVNDATWNVIDESRDAYTGKHTEDEFKSSSSITINLTRPFAKLRVVTTDIKELGPLMPKTATVNYTSKLYTSFNAYTATAGDLTAITDTKVVDFATDTYGDEANPKTGKGEMTLFADYFFGAEDDKVLFTMDVVDSSNQTIPTIVFNTNIPVQRNYLTTVKGPILTDSNNITVTIDDVFDNVGDGTGTDWNPEEDDFDVDLWDGTSMSAPVDSNNDGVYEIGTGAQLAYLAAAVNGTLPSTASTRADEVDWAKEEFILTANINLDNNNWTPIGALKPFCGTFDGNGCTIYNLYVNTTDNSSTGLFGQIYGSTIKNIKVNKATIKGHNKAGVILGCNTCGKVEGCHVDDATVTVTTLKDNMGSHVGAIVGYLTADSGAASVEKCSVKNVTITAFRDVAAVVGTATGNSKPTIKECYVENATVTADQLPAYSEGDKDGNAGVIVGRQASVTIVDDCDSADVVVIRKVDSAKELAEAVADAVNGDTIYVAAGKGAIDMPYFQNKSLSFEGIGNVVLNQPSSTHARKDYLGSELYFKSVTIDGTAYGVNPTYHGFVGALKETYDACTFTDYLQFAADDVVVNDATFVCQPGQYFWTGLSNNIEFNRCEFDGVDRALHLCSVISGETHNVTLNNCEFTATELGKAAIEIDGSKGPYVLNINKTTNTGFAEGENTGETLFNIKNTPENVTVYIDGNKWIGKGIITDEEGNLVVNSLDTLENALKSAGAAGAGDTSIVFAENTTLDMTNTTWTPIDVDGYHGADIVTIDGKGSVIKGLTAPLFEGGFAGGSGIIIKNLTITDSDIVSTNSNGSGAFIESVDSMDVITLDNCHFTNSTISGSRTGGLVGWTSGYSNVNDGPVKLYVTITNCSVIDVDINATGSAGGINGHAGASDWTYTTIEDCTVKDCNIKSTNSGGWRTGVVLGTANVGEVTINNITASGNTLEQTGKTAPTADVRRLYGRTELGTTGKLVIDGYTYVADGLFEDAEGNPVVGTQAALETAISEGNTKVTLTSGNFTMLDGSDVNLRDKTLTIVGTKTTVIDASKINENDQYVTGATLAFEGVTINFGKVNQMGFANTKSLSYKNCDINGLQFLYGPEVKFENCNLNSNGAEHCVWTYGCQNINFTDCNFTYGDRGINCYSHNDVPGGQIVNFTRCTFATTNAASEGAVEINSCYILAGISVTLDSCTAPAYGELAYISPWDSTNGARTTITIK